MDNIIAEAAKSKLGIVALLFVVAGTLARAFFGKDTSVKVRIVMFLVVLVGLSCFAAAVLIIETPETVNVDFGVGMSGKRAKALHESLNEFKKIYEAALISTRNAQEEMQRQVEQQNPFPVDDITKAEEYIRQLTDACNGLEKIAHGLKVDFADVPLTSERARESTQCRNTVARLKEDLKSIQTAKPPAQ